MQCRWMLAVTEEVWENASMARASEFTALKRERRLLFEQVKTPGAFARRIPVLRCLSLIFS
jgi:hypothetical protein